MKGLLLAAFVAFGSTCQAHEWFDTDCCDGKDCRPVALGEVKRTDEGWYIAPLQTILYFGDDRIRASRDHQMYICMIPTHLRCLYIPAFAG